MARKRNRRIKLEQTVARIQNRFGPRALVRGHPPAHRDAYPHIPTGFANLDTALGIGGLPKGKISELVGLPTSGKTTIALKLLAQAQAGGREVGYVDQARYFDPDYAHRCGIDLSRLIVGSPYELRETMAMTEALVCNGGLSALVLEVVDLLWVDASATQGIAAWLMRLSLALSHSQAALLVVHDAPDATSPALSALAHAAAIRLHVVREKWTREGGDIRGYQARVEILKSRYGGTGRTVTLKIAFNGTLRGEGL